MMPLGFSTALAPLSAGGGTYRSDSTGGVPQKGASRVDESSQNKELERLRKAASDFETILIRQMLAPLEKSMTQAMGGAGGASPMVGSMVLESLSQSIAAGGGLGFASIIEEAMRPRVTSGPSAHPAIGTEGAQSESSKDGSGVAVP